jgi:hypothetical protein
VPSRSKPSRGGRRRAGASRAAAPRSRTKPATTVEPAAVAPAPAAVDELPSSTPEREFGARVSPALPERPFPATRRAIFFDVENTSRAQHIARVIEHLAVDRAGSRTEFVAVGNWRVVGHDTARLLAGHGAHLVHSAPSVGVRDWSDLRIAVSAGVWLAAARPGDAIEIVSDDRAFDAVGDVAASLGIAFRRLSYRGLAGLPAGEAPERAPVSGPAPRAEGASRYRRRGRRRGAAPAPHVAPGHHRPAAAVAAPVDSSREVSGEPHTAPHDEIVTVVRDLVQRVPNGTVTIDTLANALKARGFRRPPGSPRLITRLRRIRELAINRTGMITLVTPGEPANGRGEPEPSEEPREAMAAVSESELPEIGNEREPAEAPAVQPGSRRRRRSRRGGRRHRRREGTSGGGPV